MRYFRIGIFLLVGAGLLACSSGSKVFVQGEELIISSSTVQASSKIETFIQPYSDSLELEMERIVGYATADMQRNRPEGTLGNFMADLSLSYALDKGMVTTDEQAICLMNHGGLRSPISQGDIRVGDIYKLMPFDNTLVVLKLEPSVLAEIHNYLISSGGEPIAGFQVTDSTFSGPSTEVLTVVTTNYLAEGGDKMTFFANPLEKKEYPALLRDIIIEQVEKMDTIVPLLDGRLNLKVNE
jgi:2',3'-cyclic-nucleotide 2'-phosphodiesterase (5'-nucleotidase family)